MGSRRERGEGDRGRPRTPEHARLAEADRGERPWRLWGPYLAERQWGTVREDYSANGDAWTYLPHDHARSRAFRWGEDGIAGISDDRQLLCLTLALWNGRDPILKERLFGLANGEGNHGEDVKELYYYLDATPTHSYLKYLYKYPQAPFPYERLVAENARRGRDEPEFELLDTGVLDEGRYFDVEVEYAKEDVGDLLVQVTATNRGPEAAVLHLLPQLCFRNIWSWGADPSPRPRFVPAPEAGVVMGDHPWLGTVRVEAADGPGGPPEFLFCNNDTNRVRHHGAEGRRPGELWKDGLNDRIVLGRQEAANVTGPGTKVAVHHRLRLNPGAVARVRLRLLHVPRDAPQGGGTPPDRSEAAFEGTFRTRRREADLFYADVQRGIEDRDARLIQRQALAGMIWSKQLYRYDVRRWLNGDTGQPAPPEARRGGRNAAWRHLNNADVISMPDKWEYPWYAAWDLAFHCLPLALVDPEFAKAQLVLLTREWYMHPNGQLPAYEWALGDVNPPVHAWAAWRVFEIDRERRGGGDKDPGDITFLEQVFHKLMLNFTWWVNRKDAHGRNVFQGGFLGLDNVGAFDRSNPPPGGGAINQADGTAWMAMYALNLMRIALELALHNPVYEDVATKFFEHFLLIAEAMTDMAEEGIGLWDETDGFYYDEIETPGGKFLPLRVRSVVGLIPLFAVEVIEPELLARLPGFARRLRWFLKNRPELAGLVSRWQVKGVEERRLLSLLRGHRMKRLLRRMLDEAEFLSPHGVRSLSRAHAGHPYELDIGPGEPLTVRYSSGESETALFGGNSNWRGPVWFPVNHLIVESLRRFHAYYGDDFVVECPTGSGRFLTLRQVADELSRRLASLFMPDPLTGARPALGGHDPRRLGPGFENLLLFHEFFDGDSGRGLGASHQTGWTGLVANAIHETARRSAGAEGSPRAPVAGDGTPTVRSS